MGDFKSNNRRGFGGGSRGSFRGGSGGGRFGERSGGGSRGGFRRSSDMQMHDATCSKCGARCKVPFRPTGNKPVFCSDCFRANEEGSNFSSRDSRNERSAPRNDVSSDQFKQVNAKLDKILAILENLEIEELDEEEGDDEDEDDEEEEL